MKPRIRFRNIIQQISVPLVLCICVGVMLLTAAGNSVSNDLNVAPSTCRAPYVDQAGPMRWHEHYLMNPSSNRDTWVICPLIFDNDILIAPGTYAARVRGSFMTDASDEPPTCFFTANHIRNTTQEPYRSGNNRTYTIHLPTAMGTGGEGWYARAEFFFENIGAAIGVGPNDVYFSVFCKLTSGYSISGINILDDES